MTDTPDTPDHIRRVLSAVRVPEGGVVYLKAQRHLSTSSHTDRAAQWVTLPAAVYDNVVAAASGTLTPNRTQGLFERRWSCGVSRSGFHNGSDCTPSDPHGEGWHCGYRWIAPLLTDREARELGIAPPADQESPEDTTL